MIRRRPRYRFTGKFWQVLPDHAAYARALGLSDVLFCRGVYPNRDRLIAEGLSR